ncbi:MAG TPA: YCF48-related protein [Blastocatellia bacterium]|nr:YCF48-related protein [Blastocatellia bacterium]
MLRINPRFLLPLLLCALLAGGFKAGAQGRDYAVQVAAFRTEAEARALVARLKARGLAAYWIRAVVNGKGVYYRVRFGRFATSHEAAGAGAAALTGNLISEFVIAEYALPGRPDETARAGSRTAAGESGQNASGLVNKSFAPALDRTLEHKAPPARSVVTLPPPPRSAAELRFTAAATSFTLPVAVDLTDAPPRPRVIAPRLPEADSAKPKVIVTAEAVRTPIPAEPVNEKAERAAAPLVVEIVGDNSGWEVVRQMTEENLSAVHFTGAQNGWVAGESGSVWHTSDGGRTWTRMAAPGRVSIVHLWFADADRGWLVAQTRDSEADETVLFQTADGGRHWTEQKLSGIVRVQFFNARDGWAVGRHAALFRTTDGGAEWKPYDGIEDLLGAQVEGLNRNFGFSDVTFTDAEHGWAVGNFYGRTRTHIGGLFATSDGGNTWKRVPLPVRLPNAADPPGRAVNGTRVMTGRIIPGLLHSVRFTDEKNGVVSGELTDDGKRLLFTLRTSDGGRTWGQTLTPGLVTESAYFLTPAQGRAAAQSDASVTILMRTEDGGATWQRELVLRGSRIRSLFFLSPGKGWAVGERGMILRYEARRK